MAARSKPSGKACCRAILSLMYPTERLRQRDSVAVMITADVWKRIYLTAKRGSK